MLKVVGGVLPVVPLTSPAHPESQNVAKSAKMTLVQTHEADAAKSSPASGHTYLFLSVSTVVLRGESSVGEVKIR